MRISGKKTAEDIIREHLEQEQKKPRTPEGTQPPAENTESTRLPTDPFILTFDPIGREYITKANELFAGTQAEIPMKDGEGNLLHGEVQNMYMLKRLALITAIVHNPELNSRNIWPITPLQSELLLKDNTYPKDPSTCWEDLALILYDRSGKGTRPQEAQALYDSLKKHQADLKLFKDDLEQRLLIINSGIEKNPAMPYGVKPIILPGITQVVAHPVLHEQGNKVFAYGLEHGLPAVSALGTGTRTLYLPAEKKDIGLRILCRGRVLGLGAGGGYLVGSGEGGRVAFGRS